MRTRTSEINAKVVITDRVRQATGPRPPTPHVQRDMTSCSTALARVSLLLDALPCLDFGLFFSYAGKFKVRLAVVVLTVLSSSVVRGWILVVCSSSNNQAEV